MSQVIVGRWGRSLGIRVPKDVARASGLIEGEAVELELQGDDILVRRAAANAGARREAEAAAQEIVAESRVHSLGGSSIRDLLDESRRG